MQILNSQNKKNDSVIRICPFHVSAVRLRECTKVNDSPWLINSLLKMAPIIILNLEPAALLAKNLNKIDFHCKIYIDYGNFMSKISRNHNL